jgi:hypothetical protein
MKLSEYYDEMRDKYGFSEGSSVPEGIERIRKLIIEKVNKKLAKMPVYKDIELREFDRAGLHNWCLISLWYKEENTLITDPSFDEEMAISEMVSDLDESYRIREKVIIEKYQRGEE